MLFSPSSYPVMLWSLVTITRPPRSPPLISTLDVNSTVTDSELLYEWVTQIRFDACLQGKNSNENRRRDSERTGFRQGAWGVEWKSSRDQGGPKGWSPKMYSTFCPFVLLEAVSPTKCCCLLKVKTFGPAQNFGQAAQLYRGIQLRDQSQLITGRGAPQLWQHLQTEQT